MSSMEQHRRSFEMDDLVVIKQWYGSIEEVSEEGAAVRFSQADTPTSEHPEYFTTLKLDFMKSARGYKGWGQGSIFYLTLYQDAFSEESLLDIYFVEPIRLPEEQRSKARESAAQLLKNLAAS